MRVEMRARDVQKYWFAPLLALAVIGVVRLSRLSTPTMPVLAKPLQALPAETDENDLAAKRLAKFESTMYPDAGADERAARRRVEAAAEAIERALAGREDVALDAMDIEAAARRGDCKTLRVRASTLAMRLGATDAGTAKEIDAMIEPLDAAVGDLCPARPSDAGR